MLRFFPLMSLRTGSGSGCLPGSFLLMSCAQGLLIWTTEHYQVRKDYEGWSTRELLP
jgi:hypothetical protein